MCVCVELRHFIFDYEEMEGGGCDEGLPEDQMNRHEEVPGEFTEPQVVSSVFTQTFQLYQFNTIILLKTLIIQIISEWITVFWFSFPIVLAIMACNVNSVSFNVEWRFFNDFIHRGDL